MCAASSSVSHVLPMRFDEYLAPHDAPDVRITPRNRESFDPIREIWITRRGVTERVHRAQWTYVARVSNRSVIKRVVAGSHGRTTRSYYTVILHTVILHGGFSPYLDSDTIPVTVYTVTDVTTFRSLRPASSGASIRGTVGCAARLSPLPCYQRAAPSGGSRGGGEGGEAKWIQPADDRGNAEGARGCVRVCVRGRQ